MCRSDTPVFPKPFFLIYSCGDTSAEYDSARKHQHATKKIKINEEEEACPQRKKSTHTRTRSGLSGCASVLAPMSPVIFCSSSLYFFCGAIFFPRGFCSWHSSGVRGGERYKSRAEGTCDPPNSPSNPLSPKTTRHLSFSPRTPPPPPSSLSLFDDDVTRHTAHSKYAQQKTCDECNNNNNTHTHTHTHTHHTR